MSHVVTSAVKCWFECWSSRRQAWWDVMLVPAWASTQAVYSLHSWFDSAVNDRLHMFVIASSGYYHLIWGWVNSCSVSCICLRRQCMVCLIIRDGAKQINDSLLMVFQMQQRSCAAGTLICRGVYCTSYMSVIVDWYALSRLRTVLLVLCWRTSILHAHVSTSCATNTLCCPFLGPFIAICQESVVSNHAIASPGIVLGWCWCLGYIHMLYQAHFASIHTIVVSCLLLGRCIRKL